MSTSDEPETTHDDNQLVKQALEIRELVQKVRDEAGLGPILKTKRPFSTMTEQQESEEHMQRLKRQQLEDEQTEKIATLERESTMSEKRTQFFNRLKSYSPRFQHRKRPFTALECAKYGWKDTHLVGKVDHKTCILQCDECQGRMFVITFDPTSDNPKVKEVTKIYKEGLINCHSEICRWRNGPDQEEIYNFPIETLQDGMKRFKENAQIFIKSQQDYKIKADTNPSLYTKESCSIPPLQHPLDESTVSKIHALAEHIQQQEAQDDNDTEVDAKTRDSAYLLSLFGWQLLDPSVPGVECELCCSRKGFYQIENDSKLDVVKQHRDYCPWVNPETADAYSPKVSSCNRNHKISGYEWMIDMISIEYNLSMRSKYLSLPWLNAADDEQYRLKQKMHQANDLLKLWNSYSSKQSE